jgi:threonine dehydrogenase-like Zn-dependent dehydrogenase
MSDVNVVVVVGSGSIGQAIARRVSVGKHVVLADVREQNAKAAAKTLSDAGYDVSTAVVDISSRQSVQALVRTVSSIGSIVGLIHAAGVSPSQASPSTILRVDLYGTAVLLEEFGAGQGARSHAGGRAAGTADAAAGQGHRSVACVPGLEARQFAPCHGRSRSLGQARRAGQHHQPRPWRRCSWGRMARSSPAATC